MYVLIYVTGALHYSRSTKKNLGLQAYRFSAAIHHAMIGTNEQSTVTLHAGSRLHIIAPIHV